VSVLIAPETRYGIEQWRWDHTDSETNPFDSSVKGMRPTHPQPYPAMMYQPLQKNPWKFNQQVAHSEAEQSNLEALGFVAGGPGKAAEHFDAMQLEIAHAAANRNFNDRNMSEKAREESERVEQASSVHVGEIPATPIKPKGSR
jgi:hypothetical protein